MARRRKIPAKKHHGVRDPIKQNELRLLKTKDQTNNPPVAEKQKLSYKMTQLLKLKEDTKAGKVKRQYRVHHREDMPRKPHQKKFQPIVPLGNETSEEYMRRVNRITREGIKEAEYEAKYGVNVIRDEKTGQITIKKRPKDELEELMKAKRKNRKGQVQPLKPAMDPREAKALIKQAIAETKKEETQEKVEEFKRDTFRFGEVVQAPPSLVVPRRAQKDETVPRPGRKDSLLLKKLFKETGNKTQSIVKTAPRKIGTDLKGKRKDLPQRTREMLEDQQQQAVKMYREMKRNKMKS